MNPDEALPALAPNQRARNLDARNQYQSFKKFIIIVVVIALLITLVVVVSLLIKSSGKNRAYTIPEPLSELPVYPEALLSGAKVSESGSEAIWKIENTAMDVVTSWYMAMYTDDDAIERFEVITAPEDFASDEVVMVFRKDSRLLNVKFTRTENTIQVSVQQPGE